MQIKVRDRILKVTHASEIVSVELIQPLWNNYGTLSRVFLRDSDYSSVIVKHIKIPDHSYHPRGFTSSISRRRKVQSYKVETHWYLHHNQHVNDHSPTPQCLDAFDEGDELFLLLEDLSTLGFSSTLRSASWSELTVVLRWLAHFHAQHLGVSAEGLWSCGTYWHLATRPEEFAKIEGTRVHHFASLLDARLRTGRFQTIVHGDAKLANFCFSDDRSEVAAVDFQYVGRGCGMRDVAYFVGSCLSETECQRLESEILDAYFSQLRSCLANEINADELEAEWRALYPIAWADFQRFMLGWSPQHQKLTSYSDAITEGAIDLIRDDLLEIAQSACLEAGCFIQAHRDHIFEISSKGFASQASDMVTEIDLQAQALILDLLSTSIERYDLGILAEEGEQDDSRLHKHAFWTIDPLDGTQYFVEGKSGYAVSIALVSQSGQSILGVVYDPITEAMYQAVRGEGVTLNGDPMQPTKLDENRSDRTQWIADRSLRGHPHFNHYQADFDVRFVGGAVMNILQLLTEPNSCYVKAPKTSLGGCAIWDLAAVSLMLEERSGSVQLYDGAPLHLNREDRLFFNDVGLVFTSPDLDFETITARVKESEI